jgi:hypothetical protein
MKLSPFEITWKKCKAVLCNHPLDPEEWDCKEKKCVKTGECKYIDK